MPRKKRNGNEEENQEKKKGSILVTIFWIVMIIFMWIAIFALLIKFDVGGLGSTLRPALKDIPVLNKVLPQVTDDQIAWEENYPYATLGEAMEQIKLLESELESTKTENNDYTQLMAELQAEIDRLKVYEDSQLAFEERVKEFDKNVVFNENAPDIEEYKKYYDAINPTTAEEIYRIVLQQMQYDDSIVEKAKILKTMKPSQAALVLEEMTADTEWIAKVLLSMKADESAAIFNKMDELYSAKILRKMADMDEEKLQNIMDSLQ